MAGIVTFSLMYLTEINRTLNHVEGAWTVLIVILIKIGILTGMTSYVLHQWFKQEIQYLSDIPFLFGLFFLFLIFGKFFDLLFFLTYFTLDEANSLFLLKTRFFMAILTLFPMMFLSIGMLLYYLSLKDKFKKLKSEKTRDKVRGIILTIIIITETIAVVYAPNITIVGILLPIFVIPSLLVIIWIFIIAYRGKRLSQVHPLILAIGFGLILISQLLRPIAQSFIGETTSYVAFTEIFDLLTYIPVVFLGFLLKIKYEID